MSSLTQGRFIAATVWQTFVWSCFRNTFTLSMQLCGTMWGCFFHQGLWKPSGTLCVLECWASGGSWPASPFPYPPLPSSFPTSFHPWCCWIESQMPTCRATPSLQLSSVHWLLSLLWGWVETESVGGTDADSCSDSDGSVQVLDAQGSLMSPGDPSVWGCLGPH